MPLEVSWLPLPVGRGNLFLLYESCRRDIYASERWSRLASRRGLNPGTREYGRTLVDNKKSVTAGVTTITMDAALVHLGSRSNDIKHSEAETGGTLIWNQLESTERKPREDSIGNALISTRSW